MARFVGAEEQRPANGKALLHGHRDYTEPLNWGEVGEVEDDLDSEEILANEVKLAKCFHFLFDRA